MAIVTTATLPVTSSSNFQLLPGSAIHDVIVQYNNLMKQQAALALAFTSDGVLKASVPSIGTTVTLALSQGVITIAGVPVSVAAQTAQAFGALGTIPASTWGIIAIDRVAAGTTTFASGAANYTTGYATEALAIAAVPAKTAAKARVGYVTVLASASTWIAGTDALAGGTGGNPATTTNYYAIASPWDIATDTANAITLGSIALTAKQIGVMNGTAITV
jgi:hypothetical protein